MNKRYCFFLGVTCVILLHGSPCHAQQEENTGFPFIASVQAIEKAKQELQDHVPVLLGALEKFREEELKRSEVRMRAELHDMQVHGAEPLTQGEVRVNLNKDLNSQVGSALKALGDIREPQAARVLAKYLDFHAQYGWDTMPLPAQMERVQVDETPWRGLATDRFPAMTSLIRIGQPAVPAIWGYITQPTTKNWWEVRHGVFVLGCIMGRQRLEQLLREQVDEALARGDAAFARRVEALRVDTLPTSVFPPAPVDSSFDESQWPPLLLKLPDLKPE